MTGATHCYSMLENDDYERLFSLNESDGVLDDRSSIQLSTEDIDIDVLRGRSIISVAMITARVVTHVRFQESLLI